MKGVDELLKEIDAIDRSSFKTIPANVVQAVPATRGQPTATAHPAPKNQASPQPKPSTTPAATKAAEANGVDKRSSNLDDLLAELDFQDIGTSSRVWMAVVSLKLSSRDNRQPLLLQGSTPAGSKTASSKPKDLLPKSSLDKLLADLHLDTSDAGSGVNSRRASEGTAEANTPVQTKHTRTSSLTTKMKCSMLCLGGSQYPLGRHSGSEPMRCDMLRCTKCDFKVVWFDDREWTGNPEYLFFRNNFPSEQKLSPKLKPKPGSSAYCCQCSWTSVTEQQTVDYGGELRWICGGH